MATRSSEWGAGERGLQPDVAARSHPQFPGDSAARRLIAMRQELLDPAVRVGLHPHQHVGEVGRGIQAVTFGRGDERVEDGVVFTRLLVVEEEVIRATEGAAYSD